MNMIYTHPTQSYCDQFKKTDHERMIHENRLIGEHATYDCFEEVYSQMNTTDSAKMNDELLTDDPHFSYEYQRICLKSNQNVR
jgi:hypothetical protein